MSAYAEALLPQLRKIMEEDCFGGAAGQIPEIAIAQLGSNAGMIGAANL